MIQIIVSNSIRYNSGRTIDEELEKQNFQKACEILASIWSNLVIDKHVITAEFVTTNESSLGKYDEAWVGKHCRVSQYLLQIVKCNNKECCGEWRTSWNKFFPDRFLPAPLTIVHNRSGPEVPSSSDALKSNCSFNTSLWQHIALKKLIPYNDFPLVPYDLYCPSLQGQIKQRVCKVCSLYHPSIASLKRHLKGKGCPQDMVRVGYEILIVLPLDYDELSDETSAVEITDQEDSVHIEIYEDIDVYLQKAGSPFEELDCDEDA